MLFRRLVVWNSTILVFLTAVFVWYNLTSTQKIVEEEVYNSFYTSMDTGAAEMCIRDRYEEVESECFV